jgi:hypothetical protein
MCQEQLDGRPLTTSPIDYRERPDPFWIAKPLVVKTGQRPRLAGRTNECAAACAGFSLLASCQFSLRIGDKGMREPHWHPRTAEMGYVLEGRARMTVLSPAGRKGRYI